MTSPSFQTRQAVANIIANCMESQEELYGTSPYASGELFSHGAAVRAQKNGKFRDFSLFEGVEAEMDGCRVGIRVLEVNPDNLNPKPAQLQVQVTVSPKDALVDVAKLDEVQHQANRISKSILEFLSVGFNGYKGKNNGEDIAFPKVSEVGGYPVLTYGNPQTGLGAPDTQYTEHSWEKLGDIIDQAVHAPRWRRIIEAQREQSQAEVPARAM